MLKTSHAAAAALGKEKGDTKSWGRMMKTDKQTDSTDSNLPPFHEVSWVPSPNHTGGVTSHVALPEPAHYQLTSDDAPCPSHIPWLQMEYGGDRDLATLHVAIQVNLRNGDFGHCLVSLGRVYEDRRRHQESGTGVCPGTRFVEPLMHRGLPLRNLDPTTGEEEVVTAVFELSLRNKIGEDQQGEESMPPLPSPPSPSDPPLPTTGV